MSKHNANVLTQLQQRFVDAYPTISPPNATQAYIKAGGKARGNAAEVSASRMLRCDKVLAALSAARQQVSAVAQVDASWVLRRLIANADRAAQVEPVLDKEGTPTGEYRYEGAVVNKALELIGKHLGMFGEAAPAPGSNGPLLDIRILVANVESRRLLGELAAHAARVSQPGESGSGGYGGPMAAGPTPGPAQPAPA